MQQQRKTKQCNVLVPLLRTINSKVCHVEAKNEMNHCTEKVFPAIIEVTEFQ